MDHPDGHEHGEGHREVGGHAQPRWQTIYGRAEGIAVGLGAEKAGTVHFLLATLWDDRRWWLTETPGVAREAIVAALAELGGATAARRAACPKLQRKVNLTQYVEFPRNATDQVLKLLVQRHPPSPDGPSISFNYKDDESAWVRAEDGIDLQVIVDEALAEEPDG